MSEIFLVTESLHLFEKFCICALMIAINVSVAICQLPIRQFCSFGKRSIYVFYFFSGPGIKQKCEFTAKMLNGHGTDSRVCSQSVVGGNNYERGFRGWCIVIIGE